MSNYTLALGDLGSVFQLAAGVALAMNVFRAPHERQFHELGKILAREETILQAQSNAIADDKAIRLSDARITLLSKGAELQKVIAPGEYSIWAAVCFSGIALTASTLLAPLKIPLWLAVILLAASLIPLIGGSLWIQSRVRDHLATTRAEIERL